MTVQTDPERTESKYLQRYANLTGKRVLEIGCGDGRLTWQYAKSADRVTGIDHHRDDLRVATIDRPSDLGQRVIFTCADSIHLPFVKESFDIAILAWSF
jgi:ubiquinone/menaquinone biosynthesis C-methylase UbiE